MAGTRELPIRSERGSLYPLVSVIVPSFNQGRFIRKTLESILSQDYRPIEILIIDGASTDGTLDVLHSYEGLDEVRWVSEPDDGVVEAVNKGLAMAEGEFCGIQSSDDYYLPGAISAAVAALAKDPALAFVFGDIAKVDAEGHELSRTELAPYSFEAVLSAATWIPQPSTFFRLALAQELGGWREEVSYAADTDLWFRMGLNSPAAKVDRLMAHRTMHSEQRDRHGDRIVRDYTKMIRSLEQQLDSRRLCRAARVGQFFIRQRYQERKWFRRTVELWIAAVVYPPLFQRLPAGAFVPGWYLLRRVVRAGYNKLRNDER